MWLLPPFIWVAFVTAITIYARLGQYHKNVYYVRALASHYWCGSVSGVRWVGIFTCPREWRRETQKLLINLQCSWIIHLVYCCFTQPMQTLQLRDVGIYGKQYSMTQNPPRYLYRYTGCAKCLAKVIKLIETDK